MHIDSMTALGDETTISVVDARARLASIIDAARAGPVRLTRRGHTGAVMIGEAAQDGRLLVVVVRIGHRSSAYRRDDGGGLRHLARQREETGDEATRPDMNQRLTRLTQSSTILG